MKISDPIAFAEAGEYELSILGRVYKGVDLESMVPFVTRMSVLGDGKCIGSLVKKGRIWRFAPLTPQQLSDRTKKGWLKRKRAQQKATSPRQAAQQQQGSGSERPKKLEKPRVVPGVNGDPILNAVNFRYYMPDPMKDYTGDGIADAPRVGVPATMIPPPPAVMRLPNLTPDERRVEERACRAYEKSPNKMAKALTMLFAHRRKIANQSKQDSGQHVSDQDGGPMIFETDKAKALFADWNHADASIRSERRSRYNTALHQVANAVTKRAFTNYLDTLKEGDQIMVTCGGCGSGKGHTLEHGPPHLGKIQSQSKAVWDSAGDQNGSENGWILNEARSRGLKVAYVYVNANPENSWAGKFGVVQRANKPSDGRMVDAEVFVDSYVVGAKNMHAFHQAHKHEEGVDFHFIDNLGNKFDQLDGVPENALNLDRDKLLKMSVDSIKSKGVNRYVLAAGLAGTERIWAKQAQQMGVRFGRNFVTNPWSASDELKHPRDDAGKFATKPVVSQKKSSKKKADGEGTANVRIGRGRGDKVERKAESLDFSEGSMTIAVLDEKKKYSVTHVKSGFSLGKFAKKSDAKKYAKMLWDMLGEHEGLRELFASSGNTRDIRKAIPDSIAAWAKTAINDPSILNEKLSSASLDVKALYALGDGVGDRFKKAFDGFQERMAKVGAGHLVDAFMNRIIVSTLYNNHLVATNEGIDLINSINPNPNHGAVNHLIQDAKVSSRPLRQADVTADSYTSQVAGKMKSTLGEEIGSKYAETFKSAVDGFGENAKTRLMRTLYKRNDVGVVPYESLAGIRDALNTIDPSNASRIPDDAIVGGLFVHRDGAVHIDGGREDDQRVDPRRHLYVHELAHAIDWNPATSTFQFSSDPTWGVIWSMDIRGRLSSYANTDPAEGFAEFARVVNERPGIVQGAKERFPAAYAYWEAHGLIGDGDTSSMAKARDALSDTIKRIKERT